MEEASPCGSKVYSQRIELAFEYSVHFTRRALDPGNHTLVEAIARLERERRHRVYAVVDDGVARAWPDLCRWLARYCERHGEHLELVEAPRVIRGGEAAKNDPGLIEQLQGDMRRLRVDRQSFCLVIGGGAVLDAVGYAAATTHRGVRLLRMPTTVLAQNDSGVGVKNAVNAFGAKNFLGTFAPPFAVINDTELLTTLDARDKRAGIAEAVKVALIRDRAFFAWLEDNVQALSVFEPRVTTTMVRRAAEIHMQHIATAGDPFELGSARPLDFGHWAAHRLESLSEHSLRHGEAVAIGMALDCRYASLLGLLPDRDLERVCSLLERLGFALYHPALDALDERESPALLTGLAEFQEHLGGELCVTLLEAIGRGVEVREMQHERVLAALSWLRDRDRAPCK